MAVKALLNSSIRFTDAIYYGEPPSGGNFVPTSRILNATYPIRIDGGASANLSADRTFSIVQSPVGASQDSVGVNRTISTTGPLQGGGALTADLTLTIDQFAGDGVPGYVPDPGTLSGPDGYFLNAEGDWVLGTTSGVPSNRTLTMGTGLLIDGLASADLSANRTITMTIFSAVSKGGVPASGGGTVNFLRADGTWAPPVSVGGFIRLQNSYPGTDDTGNGRVSGGFIARTNLYAGDETEIGPTNTFVPIGVVTTRQQSSGSLPALAAICYSHTSNTPVIIDTRRSRGTLATPVINNAGDSLIRWNHESYLGSSFSARSIFQAFQDGVGTAAGISWQWIAGHQTLNDFNSIWNTNVGAYIAHGPVSPTPVASGRLHVAGRLATDLKVKTANYTLTIDDSTVFGDCTSGSILFTLPTAVGCKGGMFTIARQGTGINSLDITTTSSQSISTWGGWRLRNPGEAITVQSDGANWWIINVFDWNNKGVQVADGSPLTNSVVDTVIGASAVWNVLGPGATFGFKAFGKISVDTIPQEIKFRVKDTSDIIIADSDIVGLSASLTDALWQLECEWLCRDSGGSVEIVALKGVLIINDPGNPVVIRTEVISNYNMCMNPPNPIAFTGGTNEMFLWAEWQQALSGNSITCISSAAWSTPGNTSV